jgi:hypothetical protein
MEPREAMHTAKLADHECSRNVDPWAVSRCYLFGSRRSRIGCQVLIHSAYDVASSIGLAASLDAGSTACAAIDDHRHGRHCGILGHAKERAQIMHQRLEAASGDSALCLLIHDFL